MKKSVVFMVAFVFFLILSIITGDNEYGFAIVLLDAVKAAVILLVNCVTTWILEKTRA